MCPHGKPSQYRQSAEYQSANCPAGIAPSLEGYHEMATKGNASENKPAGTEMEEVKEIIESEVSTLRPTQLAVLELLTGLENVATEDTDDSGAGFFGDDIAAILMSENEAEMWDADELPRLNAKILSGCELAVYGYQVKFSDDPEIVSGLIGPVSRRKMYLLVKSARLNHAGQENIYKLPDIGEEFTWNTSARFIVSKLYWLQHRGRFDNGKSVRCRIQGTDLGAGKSVEKLKPLEAAMTGQAENPPF
jgi:hypothetical protein